MVQSSRGWDAAPHSGWGVKPSAPSKGKGAKPPRGVPPGTALRNGFGAASPLPSPRAASPLRPPSGSHAPPVARTSPPLPALVGPGRQLGARRAAAAAVGRALGVRRAVFPGPGREGVHFVPDAGTVAQIVYTDDQVRPPQQVVYTADGASYTSVDGPEHTLVYIHPVEAAQVQASLPVHNQVLPSIESVDGSDPLATLQSPMDRLEAKDEEDEDEDEDTEEDEEEDGEDTDLDDWEPDPPRPFDPHDLCKYQLVSLDKGDRKDRDLHEDLWFELSDETLCNWMMFVRPAQNHLEQNLVAYQYGHHVYYTTIKNVEPKQELKVWRCITQSLVPRTRGRGRGRGKRRFGPGRRPGRPPKFIRLEITSENGEKCDDGTQDLLHFSPKEQFDEAEPAPLNGIIFVCVFQNAALQHLFIRKSFRPFKCLQCGKAFREKDKLDQHLRFHGREGNCPLTCDLCNKGFISSASLESHMKLHSDQKTYSCIFCPESFDRLDLLKDHVAIHINDGYFTCPTCKKRFPDFIQVKKHVRSFHSEKIYQCTECDKAFCRPDKLRLHMLRHSDRKDFLCSTCGKQFKRKDKLREHMQRMHNPEREAKKADRISRSKTFKPRITSTDYDSFTFKCRLCMMGFRRRGMLVNHLSKRHPDMKIEEVPELTLPIIKPNRDYFCQYCDKVYKSASKRKAHILKNHPGAELPPSIRKLRPAGPGEPDPMLSTHTQLTGTIATPPVCCPHCSKQYSSKTKMVQHIRKKHPEYAQLPSTLHTPLTTAVISTAPAVLTTDSATGETVVTTDLLTQAMTELSQTLTTDYRTPQGDYQRIQYIPVSQSTSGLQQPQHIQLQVVQVAPATSPHQSQQSTVDVGQLHDPQTYTQHAIQVQHIQVTEPTTSAPSSAQVAGQPLSPSSQQSQQGLSPTHIPGSSSAQGQTLQQQQQSASVQHTYLPNAWNSFRGYSSEIQMMTLPPGQFVITDSGVATPVTTGQVKAVTQGHYVLSESQPELEEKQASPLSAGVQVQPTAHSDLDPQTTSQQQPTQYIITTTTNGNGSSEVHITKP
ncbi:PREDICTED: PR domain zinc finger protein 10 [Hipposideros armiger]|uniref:PR domain zinc finger protein 10 n=1 Tax=Hipposideros armiger TaxID=186990 RepID=A0A8B7SSI4_HIPAR|nr:PREDICTED: PR domain zinc finger protein 10 [Hipposideros armiger]